MIRLFSRSSPAAPGAESVLRLRGVRVLVVEDDDDARDLVALLLANAGAEVTAASDSEQALEALEAHRPHVIVSDIGMPGEDGLAMLRRIRALPSSQGGETPVVALTAFVAAKDRAQAEDAGFTVHMAKPVDAQALIGVVVALTPSQVA